MSVGSTVTCTTHSRHRAHTIRRSHTTAFLHQQDKPHKQDTYLQGLGIGTLSFSLLGTRVGTVWIGWVHKQQACVVLTTQRPPGSNPRECCHCTAVTDRAFRRKLNTPSQDDLRVRVRSFCFWISLPHSVCGNTTQHPPGRPREFLPLQCRDDSCFFAKN